MVILPQSTKNTLKAHEKNWFPNSFKAYCHVLDHKRPQEIGADILGPLSSLVVSELSVWSRWTRLWQMTCAFSLLPLLETFLGDVAVHISHKMVKINGFKNCLRSHLFMVLTLEQNASLVFHLDGGYQSAWEIIFKCRLIIIFINEFLSTQNLLGCQ